MFRLDFLSCALTILSTILIGKKKWAGFALAAINSLLICIIGYKTHQIGFIPANIFCIVIYGFSIRSWVRDSRAAEWLRNTQIAEAEDQQAGQQLPKRSSSGSISPHSGKANSGKGAKIIPFPAAHQRGSRARIANRLS